jgi:hypothetical protein
MKVKLSKDANKRRKTSYVQKILIKDNNNAMTGVIINGESNDLDVSFANFK